MLGQKEEIHPSGGKRENHRRRTKYWKTLFWEKGGKNDEIPRFRPKVVAFVETIAVLCFNTLQMSGILHQSSYK